VIDPPETPETKSTRSSSDFADGPERARSSSCNTPKENAAARVPPPENDNIRRTSSSKLGSIRPMS
jgi:hypothetical protein